MCSLSNEVISMIESLVTFFIKWQGRTLKYSRLSSFLGAIITIVNTYIAIQSPNGIALGVFFAICNLAMVLGINQNLFTDTTAATPNMPARRLNWLQRRGDFCKFAITGLLILGCCASTALYTYTWIFLLGSAITVICPVIPMVLFIGLAVVATVLMTLSIALFQYTQVIELWNKHYKNSPEKCLTPPSQRFKNWVNNLGIISGILETLTTIAHVFVFFHSLFGLISALVIAPAGLFVTILLFNYTQSPPSQRPSNFKYKATIVLGLFCVVLNTVGHGIGIHTSVMLLGVSLAAGPISMIAFTALGILFAVLMATSGFFSQSTLAMKYANRFSPAALPAATVPTILTPAPPTPSRLTPTPPIILTARPSAWLGERARQANSRGDSEKHRIGAWTFSGATVSGGSCFAYLKWKAAGVVGSTGEAAVNAALGSVVGAAVAGALVFGLFAYATGAKEQEVLAAAPATPAPNAL
ncbi:hypothetical protein BH10PSE19_BH10PSE19_19580 [soil metagenome]